MDSGRLGGGVVISGRSGGIWALGDGTGGARPPHRRGAGAQQGSRTPPALARRLRLRLSDRPPPLRRRRRRRSALRGRLQLRHLRERAVARRLRRLGDRSRSRELRGEIGRLAPAALELLAHQLEPRLRRRLLGEQARLVGLEAGVPSLEERAPLARRRRLRLQRADGCLQGGAPELLRGALLEI